MEGPAGSSPFGRSGSPGSSCEAMRICCKLWELNGGVIGGVNFLGAMNLVVLGLSIEYGELSKFLTKPEESETE